MFIIGLTGGIGSGKSTIARQFEALGIDCIDADQIARDVVNPGMPALDQIAQHFGNSVRITSYNVCYTKLLRSALRTE